MTLKFEYYGHVVNGKFENLETACFFSKGYCSGIVNKLSNI